MENVLKPIRIGEVSEHPPTKYKARELLDITSVKARTDLNTLPLV
jgi:hypothetical protein